MESRCASNNVTAKQKEMLELMSFSLNSLYSLISSRHPGSKPHRKMEFFYEALAKLDREELWSSRKTEFKKLLRKR